MNKKKAVRRLREIRALNRGRSAANDVVLENLLEGEDQIQFQRSGKYQVDFSAFDPITGAEVSGDYSLNRKGRVTEYTYQTQFGNGPDYYFSTELDGTALAFELHTSAFDDERDYYDWFGDAVDIAVATGNGQPLADLIDSLPGVMPGSSFSTFLVLSPENMFYA